MRQIFGDLKRRNVYRVAVTYVVAAFVVLQLADLAAGAFGLAGWFEPMIWVVAGLSFPIALVVAWEFELTPEGAEQSQRMTSTYFALFERTPQGWKIIREVLSLNHPPAGAGQ